MSLGILRKVLLVGASGYIGNYVAKELVRRDYFPICPLRSNYPELKEALNLNDASAPRWDLSDPESIRRVINQHPDLVAVISCIASRTGGIKDSWAVDYELNNNLLSVVKNHEHIKFILLSAICVQKPKLNFQFAKLEFEKELQRSKLDYTIIRPTAFFKSLAGQVERVKRGKRFIVFDSGEISSTKPISERDLAIFIVDTIGSPSSQNKILPIGGPGPNMTQKEMGRIIFDILGTEPKFIYFPSKVFQIINIVLYPFSIFSTRVSDIREFVRIAYYYATESMLIWDRKAGQYSSEATPETGSDTIRSFYSKVLKTGIKRHLLQNNRLFR